MTSGAALSVRVCLYGLGAIGGAVGRALLAMPGYTILSGVEADPAKIGRSLASVIGSRRCPTVPVAPDLDSALSLGRPDVVIHCTGSRLAGIEPELERIVRAGIPCVTSCEEMAWPDAADPLVAQRLDAAARAGGVALLGAGVNPGFVMDALVLALSGASRSVKHVMVERILDPLTRREAFRRKVGLGLDFRTASRLVEEGSLGHVGLRQSALLVAHGLGWSLSSIKERVDVVCEEAPERGRPRRAPGARAPVVGLRQTLTGLEGRRERIRMEILMAAGVEAPHDAVTLTGTPDLHLWIQGGVPGDESTVSCLINAIGKAISASRPGLLTLLDLPPVAPLRPEPAFPA